MHQAPKDDSLKDVYSFTKKVGNKIVNLSVEELTEKVKSLVRHVFSIVTEYNDDGPVLVVRDIKMKFETDGGSDWCWLFWVLRPFETIFQSISGRLPKRERKKREKDR